MLLLHILVVDTLLQTFWTTTFTQTPHIILRKCFAYFSSPISKHFCSVDPFIHQHQMSRHGIKRKEIFTSSLVTRWTRWSGSLTLLSCCHYVLQGTWYINMTKHNRHRVVGAAPEQEKSWRWQMCYANISLAPCICFVLGGTYKSNITRWKEAPNAWCCIVVLHLA